MSRELHQRVAYAKDTYEHQGEGTLSLIRPPRYQNWRGSVSMTKAVEACRNGSCSLRKASDLYGVPKTTLYDHVSGRVRPDAASGPERYLSVKEEEELCNFLIGCSQIGYPRTRPQVLAIVQAYTVKKNIMKSVSNGWWQRFRQRHPNITLRSGIPLSLPRAMAMDRSSLDRYFSILESALKDNNILDKPKQIFNCDETGMPLAPKAPKIVTERGTKNPSCVTSSTKSQVTVLCCVNAAGDCIPPFVIFDRKNLNPQYCIGEVPNTYYGLSTKGWIDTALFQDWFCHHFLCYAPRQRPLLLVMDGHSSHFSPEMIEIAAEEQVVLFVLPPNTTNLTQPLDKGVFSSLKSSWKQVCHQFISENPGRIISRYDFSALFNQAYENSMTIKNIKSGFRTTGICPFDKTAIMLPDDENSFEEFNPHSLAKQTGLKYIPLYSSSPICQRRRPSDKYLLGAAQLDLNSTVDADQRDNQSLDSSDFNNSSAYTDPPAKMLGYHTAQFSKMLKLPQAPSKIPTKYPKSSGRVLSLNDKLEQDAAKAKAKVAKAQAKVAKAKKNPTKRRGTVVKPVPCTCKYFLYYLTML